MASKTPVLSSSCLSSTATRSAVVLGSVAPQSGSKPPCARVPPACPASVPALDATCPLVALGDEFSLLVPLEPLLDELPPPSLEPLLDLLEFDGVARGGDQVVYLGSGGVLGMASRLCSYVGTIAD